jgi:hypothetical protein
VERAPSAGVTVLADAADLAGAGGGGGAKRCASSAST